jgi:hypothetical protein
LVLDEPRDLVGEVDGVGDLVLKYFCVVSFSTDFLCRGNAFLCLSDTLKGIGVGFGFLRRVQLVKAGVGIGSFFEAFS